MKKVLTLFICMLLLLQQVAFATESSDKTYLNLYVSYETGNDLNDGLSPKTPFKTIEKAKEIATAKSKKMSGDIVVNVMKGYHFLEDTLYFKPDDSGKNGHNIIYKGENLPIVSGGKKVSGFKKSEKRANIYEAYVPGLTHLMNIYVNGEKRERSQSETRVTPIKFWDDPETKYSDDGLYMHKSDIGFFENPEDIQFYYFDEWVQNYVLVEEILQDPSNENNVLVRMDGQVWTYNNPSIDSKWREINMPFYIQNAMELLDTPGEFYYNKKTQMLYYMPKPGEDMETAEVIVPCLERLVDIYGYDVDEKVENITFDGIKFAHTTYEPFSTGSSTTRQAQCYLGWFNDIPVILPGAIEVQMAKNVNFLNNHFFGLQLCGIYFEDGVENSQVTGNSFYKCGDAGFVLGNPYTYDDQTVMDYLDGKNIFTEGISSAPGKNSNKKRLLNATALPIATSYYSLTEEDHKLTNLHTSSSTDVYMRNWMEDEDFEKYRGTWKSNPEDEGLKKSWVRYDLERPYKISEITLVFDTEETTAAERTDYEVLVSNDRHFKEYETVAIRQRDSGKKVTFELPKATKEKEFRFVMIRSLGETKLALSGAFFFSEELKPSTVYERCKNILVSNNFITCVGESQPCSGGINIFAATDSKITHNKLVNLPYSGIMASWGWMNTRIVTKNLDISHNWMESVNRLLYDGGGIYTLSRMPGAVIHDNVVKNPHFSASAYFFDQGTAGVHFIDNVTLGANGDCFYVAINCRDNKAERYYSEGPWCFISSRMDVNDLEYPILFDSVTNPNEKASSIIENAGLEESYKHLSESVGENDYALIPYSYELFKQLGTLVLPKKDNSEQRVKAILDTGDFGYKKGQLSNEYFFELTKAYEEFVSGDKDEKVEAMLDILKKERKTNAEDMEYTSVYCVYAPGAIDFNIDASNKQLTLDYVYEADLTDKKVTVYCTDGNEVAYKFDDVNLEETVKIPIYSKKTQRYEIWKLNVNMPKAEEKIKLTKDDWYSTKDDELIESSDGGRYLAPTIYSYEAMISEKTGSTSFAFKPISDKANGKYVFTLGAKEQNTSQFKIEFINEYAKLYEVSEGKEKLIDSCKYQIDKGNVSSVTYSVTEEAEGKTVLRFLVNDKLLFHSAIFGKIQNTLINYSSYDSGIIIY